ncbi:hypothetical protein [Rhizobium azibense]|uniref:PXPV repeat-containing protein n=1 Tax=Rhizobium azibense TaxID=1136135 RepID=A0A4R3RKR7_9HYPH|nr:hypothetical protein [Rhizobium azibense]TCU34242.1 hypothetical protein EV129_113227 [Rhizobium azibense]
MKKLLSALAAVGMAAFFALPVNAVPVFVPKAEQVQTGDVVEVKHRHHGHWRSDRYWNRRYAYRSCRYYGNCYYRPYGYRGYPTYYGYPRYYGGYPDYYGYHRRSGVTLYFDF